MSDPRAPASTPPPARTEGAPATLESRKAAALEILTGASSVVVALSGGVDSAVLLALSIEALGRDRVLAATGRSPSVPGGDLDDARHVAVALGAAHAIVETREMERPGYRANAGDRCFHCRTELFRVLEDLARDRGLHAVAYGAILDDVGDFRPGMEAARRHGVLAPLLDAGIDKADVRALAREAGLPVSDKPAAACLSSRLPVGTEVTPERLGRVERAEQALRELGFRQLRVRLHGDVARLELEPAELAGAVEPGLRQRIVAAVKGAGFRYVAVDLEGYRTGSLNPKIHRIGPVREGGQ